MPASDTHKKKRRKNLVLLALIFAWCALIWAVTMIRMAHAEEPVMCTMEAKECPDGSYVSRTGPDCAFAPCPDDVAAQRTFGDVLADVEESTAVTGAEESTEENAAPPAAETETVKTDGENAAADGPFIDDPGKFVTAREQHLSETHTTEEQYQNEGTAHQEHIDARPPQWWENWQDKIDPEK